MNRKQNMQRILAFTLTLIIILAVPAVAFATDVNVTADSTSVKAGDTVTVTVIVSADNIGVASGTFTYDPALLTYLSSNGGASDGYINLVSAQKGGSSSLTAVIKFVAAGEGAAEIKVSLDSVLGYDGQPLDKAEAGVSITIASSGAPPVVSGNGEVVPPVNMAQTGVAAQNVTGAAAQMYVWRDLSSLTLPSGYADRQVTYAGEYVGGAAIPDRDDMILLYLSEAAGENAGYYIYNAEKNTLYPYITITSVLKSFTIIWPDESVTAPQGFEPTTLTWDEKELPAWKSADSGDIVYLVYARNSKGETGFYLFNTEDESVQRYMALPEPGTTVTAEPSEQPAVTPVSGQVDPNETSSGITIDRTLFIALCAAAVLILAAAAVFATLYIRRRIRSKRRRAQREQERRALRTKEQQQPPVKEPEEKQASPVKEADLNSFPKDIDV